MRGVYGVELVLPKLQDTSGKRQHEPPHQVKGDASSPTLRLALKCDTSVKPSLCLDVKVIIHMFNTMQFNAGPWQQTFSKSNNE